MDNLEELRNAKALMWESLQEADADKRAPLMNQWLALHREIEKADSESAKGGDPIDEIAARRASRGGATARLG